MENKSQGNLVCLLYYQTTSVNKGHHNKWLTASREAHSKRAELTSGLSVGMYLCTYICLFISVWGVCQAKSAVVFLGGREKLQKNRKTNEFILREAKPWSHGHACVRPTYIIRDLQEINMLERCKYTLLLMMNDRHRLARKICRKR